MINATLIPYGHAHCPNCLKEYDLRDAKGCFFVKLPFNDILVYLVCPECQASFSNSDAELRKKISDRCFINHRAETHAGPEKMPTLSVTSALTLEINDWDVTAAIENGLGLTRDDYFAICGNENGILKLPGGLIILTQESGNGGAS